MSREEFLPPIASRDVYKRQLTDYQRGYFVCTLRVLPAPNGGALVQATAKITAWYMDPTSSQPGYRELVSNGRVETDLLDQIEQGLPGNPAGKSAASRAPASAPSAPLSATNAIPRQPGKIDTSAASSPDSSSARNTPGVPAPAGRSSKPSATASADPAPLETVESIRLRRGEAERQAQEVSADIKSLEEIQQNQVRPADLVAVSYTHLDVYKRQPQFPAGPDQRTP